MSFRCPAGPFAAAVAHVAREPARGARDRCGAATDCFPIRSLLRDHDPVDLCHPEAAARLRRLPRAKIEHDLITAVAVT